LSKSTFATSLFSRRESFFSSSSDKIKNPRDELLVAIMPPRRRVSFLLGGAVSSSMLRGDSKTKCLLKDVVEDGLDETTPSSW
jgi:hypothetical protein